MRPRELPNFADVKTGDPWPLLRTSSHPQSLLFSLQESAKGVGKEWMRSEPKARHKATEKPTFRTRAPGCGHVPAAAFLGLPEAVKVVTLSSDGFSGHSGSHITPLSSKPSPGLALSSNPLTPTPSK